MFRRVMPSAFRTYTAPVLVSCMNQQRWNTTDGKVDPELEKEAPPASKGEQLLKEKDEELKLLNNKLLYAVSDAENARRIGREDVAKARDYAVTSFAKDMLDVNDTLEKAIASFKAIPQEELDKHKALQQILTGIKMTNTVLMKAFSKNGIEGMDVNSGDAFNPNQHDAIFTAPISGTALPGTISNVVQKGYTLKERVLRAAQVGVYEK